MVPCGPEGPRIKETPKATEPGMRHPLRYRIEWLPLVLLRGVACALPRRLSVGCGALVGNLVRILWRVRRRIALDNLTRAFPDWRQDAVHSVCNSVFRNLGRTAFEILCITDSTPRRLETLVESPSLAMIEDAHRQGRGAILMSGHIGNWELFAGYLQQHGFPIDVVVKPMRNPFSDAFYNARRRQLGVGVIHTQTATRGIIQSLRAGRMVAILADQYAGEEGVEVEFFGRMVSTPRGPAALALRFGCPILSGIMIRLPDGQFRIELDEPLSYQATGDEAEDVRVITQRITARLENHIRKYPDQWLWTHRRWRD